MQIIYQKPAPLKALSSWLKANLKKPFKLVTSTDGYCIDMHSIHVNHKIAFDLIPWDTQIARVEEGLDGPRLVLTHPEWASDITDLMERYEQETGMEATIIICESK